MIDIATEQGEKGTLTALDNKDPVISSVFRVFSEVRGRGRDIKGLPKEFTLNECMYQRLLEDPQGVIDVSSVDLRDPATRIVFLYGANVYGDPLLVPDAVHLFGEVVPSPADTPPGVTYRKSTIVDILPNTLAGERIINEGPARLFGFTRLGASAHTVKEAEVGGNVVYEMKIDPDNPNFQIMRDRLLAMWCGSAAE